MSDVPQLQNTVHLNNPALSPPERSLATADHDGKTHAHNLSTKSPKIDGFRHMRVRVITFAAADEHPEETGEFEHHLRGRFRADEHRFQLRNKEKTTRATTHLLGSVSDVRWRLICLGSFARFLPIRAFSLYAR